MSNWFVDGLPAPLSFNTLIEQVATRQIDENVLVSSDGVVWHRLDEIPGLEHAKKSYLARKALVSSDQNLEVRHRRDLDFDEIAGPSSASVARPISLGFSKSVGLAALLFVASGHLLVSHLDKPALFPVPTNQLELQPDLQETTWLSDLSKIEMWMLYFDTWLVVASVLLLYRMYTIPRTEQS